MTTEEQESTYDPSIVDDILYDGGIKKRKSTDYFTRYNHLRLKDASSYAQAPLFYVFMTAPQLNLNANTLSSLPFLATLNNEASMFYGKKIIDSMDASGGGGTSERILKILTNQCESFTPMDIAAQTVNHSETWTKLKHAYPGEDNDSRSAGTFSMEYKEKPGIPITKTHKVWYDYIQACRKGYVLREEFIRKQRAVDYFSSLYFFLIEPDHKGILFYSRYTGVVPTGLPFSAFEGKKAGGEPIKVTIPYSYTYKEEMEPEILLDFNDVVKGNVVTGSLFDAMQQFPGKISGMTTSLFKDLFTFFNPFASLDDPQDILETGRSGNGSAPLPALNKNYHTSGINYLDEEIHNITDQGGSSFAYVARETRKDFKSGQNTIENKPVLVFSDYYADEPE